LRLTTFNDEKIELGFAFAQRRRGLIVVRSVTIERSTITWKFQHDGARAHFALDHLATAAAHQEAPAKSSDRPNGTMSAAMYAW
jgi:hypothetical protein